MANTPTKGYNKYFELNAREHTIYVLAKEYKKTENGDTLCALTSALKGCKNNFEVFEKMVSYLNQAGLIGKICEFAGSPTLLLYNKTSLLVNDIFYIFFFVSE